MTQIQGLSNGVEGGLFTLNEMHNGFLLYVVNSDRTKQKYLVYGDTVEGWSGIVLQAFKMIDMNLAMQESVLTTLLDTVREIRQQLLDRPNVLNLNPVSSKAEPENIA